MPKKVEIKNGENFETLFNTFRRVISKDGDLKRVRARSAGFIPKSLKRKIKAEEARRKK